MQRAHIPLSPALRRNSNDLHSLTFARRERCESQEKCIGASGEDLLLTIVRFRPPHDRGTFFTRALGMASGSLPPNREHGKIQLFVAALVE